MASTFVFGQWRPTVSQLFFRSKLSLGLVNLKPVVPGNYQYDITFDMADNSLRFQLIQIITIFFWMHVCYQ